jgi:hypothetical protein
MIREKRQSIHQRGSILFSILYQNQSLSLLGQTKANSDFVVVVVVVQRAGRRGRAKRPRRARRRGRAGGRGRARRPRHAGRRVRARRTMRARAGTPSRTATVNRQLQGLVPHPLARKITVVMVYDAPHSELRHRTPTGGLNTRAASRLGEKDVLVARSCGSTASHRLGSSVDPTDGLLPRSSTGEAGGCT